MIHHKCGTDLPADVGALTTHLAECPHSGAELAAWCRAIVAAVAREADRMPERPEPVSTGRLAVLRDQGLSLRDLATLADCSPETVRQRLARHAADAEGTAQEVSADA